MRACMHTAAYTFISDIFLLLLMMMMRTYLINSSVPPCQEKNFHIFMGGLNLFSPQFFSFLVRNYFSLASKRSERYEALDSLL